MSKIGKLPIPIPEDVKIEISDGNLKIHGPKGSLERVLPRGISANMVDGNLLISSKDKSKLGRALYGTIRSLVSNMVKGVSQGWSKTLELVGTGYRAEVSGDTLVLSVGYSHPVKIEAPKGITFKVMKNEVTVEGVDKELVGQISARIREVKPPEPYKGKGISYKGEKIRRKAGKAAKAVGVAG